MNERVLNPWIVALTAVHQTLKFKLLNLNGVNMSDINETLLNYYEEALDMGMNEYDAKEWAWD